MPIFRTKLIFVQYSVSLKVCRIDSVLFQCEVSCLFCSIEHSALLTVFFLSEMITFIFSWAFGVVLWEIVTLGASPYPGMNSYEVVSFLQDGFRMDKPKHCSDEL